LPRPDLCSVLRFQRLALGPVFPSLRHFSSIIKLPFRSPPVSLLSPGEPPGPPASPFDVPMSFFLFQGKAAPGGLYLSDEGYVRGSRPRSQVAFQSPPYCLIRLIHLLYSSTQPSTPSALSLTLSPASSVFVTLSVETPQSLARQARTPVPSSLSFFKTGTSLLPGFGLSVPRAPCVCALYDRWIFFSVSS